MNNVAMKAPPALKPAGGSCTFNREYLRRLKDRDPETQRHFAWYFGTLLSVKLRNRVRSPYLAEEVRQETLLRVLLLVGRDGVNHPECLGSLVNAICNRVLLETFRREGRTSPRPERSPDPIDESPDPEAGFLAGQRRSQVRLILNELRDKDRELLRLVFIEEKDRDEVCRTLKVGRGYFRVLLHRAREQFRTALESTPM